MPPAVLVPVGLAVASAVGQNIANKSAAKNNQTQQQASVNNATGAWQGAQKQMAPWLAPGAPPFSSAQVGGPPQLTSSAGQQGGPINAAELLGGVSQPTPQASPALLQMIQAALMKQPPTPPSPANTPSLAGNVLRRVQ